MKTLPATTDVVIVGAGPTGLSLACVLAAEGVSFVLVDQLAEGANTSRAAVVHARTLEVLEELKVTDRLRAEGHVVPRFTLRDRDQVLATIDFDQLRSRYPYTLMVPQNVTEAILLGRLRELSSDVHRPYAVNGLQQDANGVSVTMAADGRQPQTVRARYLVGADGMHSRVREGAAIGFTGDRYEQSFMLADVRMSWPLRSDEVMMFLSPGGLVVVAPLPGGRHRIVATLDDAPEHPSMADVQRLLDTRGPVAKPARVQEIVWSTRFLVHRSAARSGTSCESPRSLAASSPLLPHLDLQRAVPIRQTRDVGIGERLGDDVHHRVRALAAAKGLELFHEIDPRLAREVGRIRGVADPQRSVADGAGLGLRAPRRRGRRRGARAGRREKEQCQALHFFGASPA